MKEPVEHKIHRLQWIQMNLSAKHSITRQEIMDRFGVGKTTAKSDLNYFRNFNIIEWSSEDQRYNLIDHLKSLPGLFISQKEWMALTFTEVILNKHASAFSRELLKFRERYQKDMNRLLPIKNIGKHFSVNLSKIEDIEDTTFETCIYAMVHQIALRITYHKPLENEVVERTISPYHLVNEGGKWLMVSWDHQKKELRNFMPSRIRNVCPEIGAEFSPLPLRDIEAHLFDSYGLYKGRKLCDAVMLFSEEKSIWANHQHWHPMEKKEWNGKRLKLTLPIASYDGIIDEILCHGSDIEVMSPPRLRELVKLRIKEMQEIYE